MSAQNKQRNRYAMLQQQQGGGASPAPPAMGAPTPMAQGFPTQAPNPYPQQQAAQMAPPVAQQMQAPYSPTLQAPLPMLSGQPMAQPMAPAAMSPQTVKAHSAPAPKLDADKLPNPTVGFTTADIYSKIEAETEGPNPPRNTLPVYNTAETTIPPRSEALVDYFVPGRSPSLPGPLVNDAMNASPRFLRSSLYTIPSSSDYCKQIRIPLGIVSSPMASLLNGEPALPVVESVSEEGPVRCNRCKAYINPHVTWDSSGNAYSCSLCGFTNEIPPHYYSAVINGQRQDLAQRPELWRGSVEFAAPTTYSVKDRPPAPPAYLFLIDTSTIAVQQGLLQGAVVALQRILPALFESSPVKVGIMTFDSAITCYNISPNLKTPQILTIADVSAPFVPIPAKSLFHSYAECKTNLEAILQMLPTLVNASPVPATQVATGAAVRVAVQSVAAMGTGKVMLFTSSLPTAGPGRLQKRDQAARAETDEEKKLFVSQTDFWKKMAEVASEKAVGIDLFITANSYFDIQTMGALAESTGGQIYYYPGYNPGANQEQLFRELHRNLSREAGFDCVMRIRCGNGLSVVTQRGHYHPLNATDMAVATISSDANFSFEFDYDEKFKDDQPIVFQIALLYTSTSGQRRIRIHTIKLMTSSILTKLFKSADLEAIIHLLTRPLREDFTQFPMRDVRKRFLGRCVGMLSAYRQYCASNQSEGQLVLPESLKLLPIYALGITKSPLLSPLSPGTYFHCLPDARSHLNATLNSIPLRDLFPVFYPYIWEITSMVEHTRIGTPDAAGIMIFPGQKRASRSILHSNEVYLIDVLTHLYLWVGTEADPEIIAQLLPQDYYNALSQGALVSLAQLDTDLSTRLFALLSSPRLALRSSSPDIVVIKQGTPLEARLAPYFVEDGQTAVAVTDVKDMTYVDFLTHLHRRIQAAVANS